MTGVQTCALPISSVEANNEYLHGRDKPTREESPDIPDEDFEASMVKTSIITEDEFTTLEEEGTSEDAAPIVNDDQTNNRPSEGD